MRIYLLTTSIILTVVCLSVARSACAEKADGGYECDRLPGDEGWVEKGNSFLGDYVTVSDGNMTYDGKVNPAQGASGMRLAQFPLRGKSATIEYRVRCRTIGGDPKQWFQTFLMPYFYCERFGIFNSLGRRRGLGDQDHKITFNVFKPESVVEVPPPTKTGTWETNEWITIRHIVQDSGNRKYQVESWVSGPGGEKKCLDITKDYPGLPPEFCISITSGVNRSAVFDLDYVRWSNKAVPWVTPLEPASRAPTILSKIPRGGRKIGGTKVFIKGSNFDARTKVTFGGLQAENIKFVNPRLLTCVTPAHPRNGWAEVVVSNTEGSNAATKGFFYGVLPEVKGIRPPRGTNLGGQTITITGSGFQPGARITFVGIAARNIKVINSETITCQSPATQGRWRGIADVAVTNGDEGYHTAREAYTYLRSSKVRPKVLGWYLELHDFNLPVAIQKLEEMPFHGVFLRPDCSLGLHNGKVTQKEVDRDTAVLKAVDFQRFRDNFLFANFRGSKYIGPSLDFFEDWSSVISGYRRYARMVKEIGFRGFWLDYEDYDRGRGADLSYATRNDKSKSFAECEAQVTLRARQIMLAMLGEFPKIKILTSFGLGAATSFSLDLLPAFYNGLLEAIDSDSAYAQAQVIDGYEAGYYITTQDDYRKAYSRMRKPGGIAYQRTSHDRAWADYGAASFGIYPGQRKMDEFNIQLSSAMQHTDEFVWTFTHGSFFSTNSLVDIGGTYAQHTDRYIQILTEATGLEHATPAGRHRTIGHWRLEEGRKTRTVDQSIVGFDGTLSDDGIWTDNTPKLPKAPDNNFSLDFRGNNYSLRIHGLGYHSRQHVSHAVTRASNSSHLGNLYFTDHTIEFSFWWDGAPSADPQYLYGADGGKDKAGHADTFAYGGWIPAGTRKLVHWQRGNYGNEYGGIKIDLEKAKATGAYRFGQWANIAIRIKSIHSRKWSIFLNGKEIRGKAWAGVYHGHETIGGYLTPLGKPLLHAFLVDLVLGARNADEMGIIEPFNGMLDEFRISAGQVPNKKLLSVK